MNSKQLLVKFKNIGSPKHLGEKTLLSTLANLKKEKKIDPRNLLHTALSNLLPGVKLLSQVRAGKVIYLPSYLRTEASYYYAMKWIYGAARDRNRKVRLSKNLSDEISDTLDQRGLALKSKRDLIKAIRAARVNLRKPFRFRKNPFSHLSSHKKRLRYKGLHRTHAQKLFFRHAKICKKKKKWIIKTTTN